MRKRSWKSQVVLDADSTEDLVYAISYAQRTIRIRRRVTAPDALWQSASKMKAKNITAAGAVQELMMKTGGV